ncbi:MAG: CtsR family transcriptional regulator [Ruminococcaceae bacterium]|nr:CtsR family transcriptional regulator [Oscillospiraceae bacterium]
MLLSQKIALMLEEMLEESGGELSIVRNELASRLGCVPSQINYVITSRFTPERGYVVESRRGGGGYIRIRKIAMSRNEYLMHLLAAIGDRMDREDANYFLSTLGEKGILSSREARLSAAALSDNALAKLGREERSILRADLMKQIVLQILSEQEEIL